MNFIRLKVWWLWMFERINWYSWCYSCPFLWVFMHALSLFMHVTTCDVTLILLIGNIFYCIKFQSLTSACRGSSAAPEPLVAALLVSQVKDEILLLRFHSFILTFKDTLQHLTCWAWFFHLNVRHETGLKPLKLWTFFGNFKRSYKTWVEMSFRKCVDES